MKLVAVLPPSAKLPGQKATLEALFSGHRVAVVTGPAELEPHLADVEAIVSAAFTPLRAATLRRAPRLRLIQVAGAGVDHVDLEAARALGIGVASAAGANAASVAEHVVMAALALLRGLAGAHHALREGGWPLAAWLGGARDLAGRTVGIVGPGRVGREVALRLAPFGATLLYHGRRRLPAEEEASLGVRHADLGALLRQSDLVTLHLPLTPETRGFLGREELAAMKRGAFLINTARAELVDEAALLELLPAHLGGAALDVYPAEPPPPDHPLRRLPNVLLTPHGAGATVDAQNRIAQAVVRNLFRFLAGEPLADLVVEGHRRS